MQHSSLFGVCGRRQSALDPEKTYTVRDVMENAEAGEATASFTTDVRKHATRVFRLAEKKTVDGVASPLSAKVAFANGTYLVTVVCNAQATTVKVAL